MQAACSLGASNSMQTGVLSMVRRQRHFLPCRSRCLTEYFCFFLAMMMVCFVQLGFGQDAWTEGGCFVQFGQVKRQIVTISTSLKVDLSTNRCR